MMDGWVDDGSDRWCNFRGFTDIKERVKWNLCLRPLKVTKDWPGKLRVVISQ